MYGHHGLLVNNTIHFLNVIMIGLYGSILFILNKHLAKLCKFVISDPYSLVRILDPNSNYASFNYNYLIIESNWYLVT